MARASIAASAPESLHPSPEVRPARWHVFRLELGPIPLHHQVYLDLKAALDERESPAPATGFPPNATWRSATVCSLITVRG